MPELPEVETIVRGLRAVLPGRRITGVRLSKTDFIEDPAALEREIPGSRIRSVQRRGKFLVIELEKDESNKPQFTLLVHLGMTGQLLASVPGELVAPHTHVFFSLDDGREIRYRDPRRFGQMRILANGQHKDTLAGLGAEPLEASESEFRARLQARRARIKALLLDQRVFSGMGNIYTDESLWRARIHPMRLGATLTDVEIRRLRRAVRDVLASAIRHGGSSISDYVDAQGQRGEFQRRHRVYQRLGLKCFRCGARVRRVIVAGRSSYFCPRCQPSPRKHVRSSR